MKTSYRSQYKENTACYSSSTSSLSSSVSSTSSSIQSLNSNHSKQPIKSNKDIIRNLKQNLDQVLKQKNDVLKKLDALGQLETSLKSKLTQNDLDEVLSILKNRDVKMHSFDRYDQGSKLPIGDGVKTTGEDVSGDMDSTLVVGENNLTG